MEVPAGGESSQINLPIRVNTVTVSGNIVNPEIIIPESTVTIRTSRFMLLPVGPNTILDASPDVENAVVDVTDRLAGKFEIQGVRPGTYDVVAIFRIGSQAWP